MMDPEFWQDLAAVLVAIALVALAIVALAIVIVLAPAAHH